MKNEKSINVIQPPEQPSPWWEEWLQSLVEKLNSDDLTPGEREICERAWAKAVSVKTAEKRQREKQQAKLKAAQEDLKAAQSRRKAAQANLKAAQMQNKTAQELIKKAKGIQEKTVQALFQAGLSFEEVVAATDYDRDFVKKIEKDLADQN